MERVEIIRQRITDHLKAESVEVRDDSHHHAGHAGTASGAGHYAVKIISDMFAGKSLIERHRMVYNLFMDMMPNDIHALSIQTYTTEERQ
jgi:BolA protein